jgi:hypothetical protein
MQAGLSPVLFNGFGSKGGPTSTSTFGNTRSCESGGQKVIGKPEFWSAHLAPDERREPRSQALVTGELLRSEGAKLGVAIRGYMLGVQAVSVDIPSPFELQLPVVNRLAPRTDATDSPLVSLWPTEWRRWSFGGFPRGRER